MVKKIPNVSRWGQDKARSRYQFGGMAPGFVPPQTMTRPGMPMGGLPPQAAPQAAAALAARPALPAQAMGHRPFKSGGKIKRQEGGSVDNSDRRPIEDIDPQSEEYRKSQRTQMEREAAPPPNSNKWMNEPSGIGSQSYDSGMKRGGRNK